MNEYNFKYKAFIGYRYRLQKFDGIKDLKTIHRSFLGGKIEYIDDYHVNIYTDLSYEIGQGVSIGGFPIGNRYFELLEVSITDNPVIEGAQIIEKEKIK